MITYQEVLNVLTVVDSSERSPAQQQAENQLLQWESEPGYHLLLQEVYLNQDLPLSVRWIAVICFKNGIEKHWRSSRPNAITKEEKVKIRARLFAALGEKNTQLTIQNAHATARIVRFDFPGEWSSLFDDLARLLEELVFVKSDIVATNNLLVILNQVIKAISMVRIGRARHALQAKAPIITPVLVKLYVKFFQTWVAKLDPAVMDVCYMFLKNLRRIIPEGFEQPHKNHDVVDFLKLSITHLQGLVVGHEKYPSDTLERFVKCYSKLYLSLIHQNPTSFVMLPCAREVFSTFLSILESKAEVIYNNTEENNLWEALALKGFLILKKMVAFVYKKGAVTLKQRHDKDEVNNAVAHLRTEFFTPAVIINLCDLIINWYLRLKKSDLDSWLVEPEEWTNEELSTSWEFQVRPCAENFYQDLIKYFLDELSDFVLNKISNGLMSNDSVENILIKDATLCTFQLSSDAIANKVNFDQLLRDVFIPEALRDDRPETKIVKRRVCLVINAWIGINCSRAARPEIYSLLVSLLQQLKLNDKVVCLTATQTLRNVVNDWDFVKNDFTPFLVDSVLLCLRLIEVMDLTESKLFILDTLATLIEKCTPLIDYHTLKAVLDVVPQYWEYAGNSEELILGTSLLRLLKQLVVALNDNSPETHSITLPLIKSCCDPSTRQYALLSEDGFELWLAVLQYYPSSLELNGSLVEALGLLQPALVDSTEILPTILSIARSYALILPSAFMGEFGLPFFEILAQYLPKMRDDSYDIYISIADILFLHGLNEALGSVLMNSGLMASMINYVLDENNSIVLANKILLVLSRVATNNAEMMIQMLDALPIDANHFIDIWMQYYKNNGSPRNKKINLLALLSLTRFGVPRNILKLPQHLPEILRRSFLFMEEVNENDTGDCKAYEGDHTYPDVDNYAYLDALIPPHGEKIRFSRLLESQDPVHIVGLREYVKQTVVVLLQQLGETDFNALMSLNDSYTLEKLKTLQV